MEGGGKGRRVDAGDDQVEVREQDQYMPIANVIRIMRRILPAHAKISDDAKETIQECVSEYISFITGEANDRCQREQRKTITAEDVIWAMGKLGFDDYVHPLTLFLTRHRDSDINIIHDHHHLLRNPHHPPPAYSPQLPPPTLLPPTNTHNTVYMPPPMGDLHCYLHGDLTHQDHHDYYPPSSIVHLGGASRRAPSSRGGGSNNDDDNNGFDSCSRFN